MGFVNEFDFDEKVYNLNFVNIYRKFPETSGIFCEFPIHKINWKFPRHKMCFILTDKRLFDRADHNEVVLFDSLGELKILEIKVWRFCKYLCC